MNRRAYFLVVAAIAILVGCTNNKEVLVDASKPEVLTIDMFKHYGEMHNQFLINAYNNYEAPRRVATVDEVIEHISQFNIAFVDGLDLTDDNKSVTIQALQDYKHFVNTTAFYAKYFVSPSKSDRDTALYFKLIEQAARIGTIDDFELEQINLIGHKLQENHDGLISDAELHAIISRIKDHWEAMEYNAESNKGHTLGVVLSISLASLEWWAENPEAVINQEVRIAPWVAADIAGAVVGAASAAINGAINNGDVSGSGVGLGAAIGAVTGSTGVVGKLAKAIQKVL